jgi:kumamolisin
MASLTIRLRSVGDPSSLIDKAYQLGNTPLGQRQYLTHDQLEAAHGASAADLTTIEQFAQTHNLTIARRSAGERSVTVRGRLGDLLNAFHADVRMYHHAAGTYRGRTGEISIPQELSGVVTGVFGFDTRPKQRTPRRLVGGNSSGPGGDNGVPSTYFANRYQFPTKAGPTALDGTGQTVAIIELGGGYQNSDLQVYFQEINATAPSLTSVSVDGATNAPNPSDPSDGEVMLDIEVVGAVVPQANIVVYFAPNNGDQGFMDAISAAVHDAERKPDVISISWGGPEDYTDAQALQAFRELFAAAATLGITVCAASGDHGTADLDASHWDQKVHVDHPACDDLVLGCGGTQIDSASEADVAWNDGTPFDPNVQGGGGWAGGGGISQVIPVPSYQNNANLPVSIVTGKPGRGVPDIAMSAVNYFVRVDTYEGASGGTSAVAPLMAGLIARLNQAKQKRVGFINPFLYANAAAGATNDVTGGTNAIKNTVKGYNAGPGWDACTGLGTPNGTNILDLL